MLNCISSIGDLLWSSALTLAMAVKEVGALQGDARTSGKCSNKAASPKQATESLAGGLTYQVVACSYPRVLVCTRLKEQAPGRVLFAMGTNPLWA
jgi:hypothetical protein